MKATSGFGMMMGFRVWGLVTVCAYLVTVYGKRANENIKKAFKRTSLVVRWCGGGSEWFVGGGDGRRVGGDVRRADFLFTQ